ncbi:uncharacterized protein PGTG_03719 [Puccinia graminis f. sp. tritici CRL 75-36-700-3]|uniref:Uncharacterized protein n=1 Tax=Puccinia graminis f. sp. tritici (strain CRL 75-36-700-3 / race SCCL) TaxID=418459 RepID=E3K0D8_PUCGT|nr:uncharacterized protein PGTG_03719 [Puccinia graminis f. sp. tritici CRL 75-36-700-3]EFP77763.1 hypothetical protein PGTG_03719 [Puccinia graminis f. sp. tritici CRL 75-36-700-3]
MVDANNTRATSKKIKESAAAKTRSEDTPVANSLIPGASSTSIGSDAYTQANNGTATSRALNGSLLNPTGVTQNDEMSGGTEGDERPSDEVVNLLIDTSESRRDRAPAALIHPLVKAKTGAITESHIVEEEEEDRSPAIAEPSIMAERQQMWDRAISAQDSGDVILAEMLFKAIGLISKAAANPTRNTNVFAMPSRAESGEITYLSTKVAAPPPAVEPKVPAQDPDKFFLKEGDLVYAIGSVTNHNSVGFAPFLDEKIRKLRSPLPLTIFNRKWQQRAMAHHLDRRQRSDDLSADKDKSGGYKGFAFVQEWTQTYAQWTRNHRAFAKTLHDVYKIIKFSKLLATHKNNCDDITEEFGFMVAFRYDMEVRSNTFSHRITDEDVKKAIPDISQRKESVVEQCYNTCRNFGELEWEENLYAPGFSHSNHDPLTGYLRPSRNGASFLSSQHSNAMVANPNSHGQNWMNPPVNSYMNGVMYGNQNYGQPLGGRFNHAPNNQNQGFQNGAKRPRGGYKGGNYSDNFGGKVEGGQANGRKNNSNK